jgi:hypothetical protein
MYIVPLVKPLRCSSTTAQVLSYYRPSVDICVVLLAVSHANISSFGESQDCYEIAGLLHG